MYILHDDSNIDLSHIQAIAAIEEGFGLFDYVKIGQQDNKVWIGQIVQPNRNISTVGSRLDPTILHGLKLMQTNSDVQSTASVQVFDILILGQYDGGQMLTPRLRPMPGSFVEKLQRDDTINVIGIPSYVHKKDSSNKIVESNVIGILLNADGVPLCFSELLFNYHVMLAGGTGSGKSNAAANLVWQATRTRKCVLIHDAKPDYGMIDQANTDPQVSDIWQKFADYGLRSQAGENIIKVGFYKRCDPNSVDMVVGFRASHFNPEMLAALMFPDNGEQNQYEAFAGATHTLRESRSSDNSPREYSLDDILELVEQRMDHNTSTRDQIHEATGRAILRKVQARRQNMPWLDAIGNSITARNSSRLRNSRLDNQEPSQNIQEFNITELVQEGRIIVIDYSQMDEESYALILSYFLRECQRYRRARNTTIGTVQLVDEAHRIFDNQSRHSGSLSRSFSRVMREGRSVDHSIILSLQNASQIPSRVMNNLNSKIVMRQNSKGEADAATQTMGRDFSIQSMRLGTGHALVSLYESRAVVLAHLAPSPYELMRNDNTGQNRDQPTLVIPEDNETSAADEDIPF